MADVVSEDVDRPTRGPVSGLRDSAMFRALLATAVALGMLGIQLFVLLQSPLSALPDYPALGLTFLIAILLPGLVVQSALLSADDDLVVRLAVAPVLGLAVMAVPGAIALEFHSDLQTFAVMFAMFAAGASGLAIIAPRVGPRAPGGEDQRRGAVDALAGVGDPLLAALLLVVLIGIVTTPLWASGRLAGDLDDWTYMAYVRDYVDTDALNEEEPFIGTGESVNPRMRTNVWVLSQALLSDAADVEPSDVLFEYLPPLLSVLAVAAVYAVTFTLFRNRTIALLAAAFLLGYAFLDLAPHEGMGRNLFLRVSEDKMVGAFLFFPVALVFQVRFFLRPAAPAYVGFALTLLALAVVHPVPLVFAGVAVVGLGLIRAWSDRSIEPLKLAGVLLLPIGLLSLWPLVQRELLIDTVPQVWDSATRFRENYRFVRLGGGLLIGNYHLIIHPMVLAALVFGPLTLVVSRRRVGNQVLAALCIGALLLLFFPLFSTPLAKVMAPQTLARVYWLVPVAPTLAYATWLCVDALGRWRLLEASKARVLRPIMLGIAPAAAVVLVLLVALVVQEQYARADQGGFYNRISETSLVPGVEYSIFLGGIDRAFSADWRLEPEEQDLFDYMRSHLPKGAVVLVQPRQLGVKMPGMLTDIFPVDRGSMLAVGERREDATAFELGELSTVDLRRVIDSYGVTHIIVREVGPATEVVRLFSRAEFVAEVSPYVIYEVR